MSITGADVLELARILHDLDCPYPANSCNFNRRACCMPYVELIMKTLKLVSTFFEPHLCLTKEALELIFKHVWKTMWDELNNERGTNYDRINEWASVWEKGIDGGNRLSSDR